MKGTGRGKSGRGWTSCGRKNFQGRGNFGATSQPRIQTRRVSGASAETGQPCNPSQRPLPTGRVSTNSLQKPSLETQSTEMELKLCIALQRLKIMQFLPAIKKKEEENTNLKV